MKTDNELVEDFWVSQGGKPHLAPDIEYYQSSWDMLMPVVEKIDSLGYLVTIMRTRTIIAITLNVQNHIQSIHPGYSMIEVAYCAVVQFIKWYNSQNS